MADADPLVTEWRPSGGYKEPANETEKAHLKAWEDILRQVPNAKKYTLLGFAEGKGRYRRDGFEFDVGPINDLYKSLMDRYSGARARWRAKQQSSSYKPVKRHKATWAEPTIWTLPTQPLPLTTATPISRKSKAVQPLKTTRLLSSLDSDSESEEVIELLGDAACNNELRNN